ncbi:hypothetical protein ACIGW8_31725 [Streptomyces sioyaensis]|uniref:hypothetical protein n=1 Tax=Streptomyces sioyaensis TaxID=67364 RepID=UPI0037D2FA67
MTGYTHSELNLTDPTKGYTQFVLYTEPRLGVACASLNATVTIRRQTPYTQEWRDRLQRCVPSALHATLVDSMMIPKLFEPCVDEDRDSSSAVRRSSCACYRTWYDPEFGLPVVGEHYRTVGGDIDDWTYTTYTPLDRQTLLGPAGPVRSAACRRMTSGRGLCPQARTGPLLS